MIRSLIVTGSLLIIAVVIGVVVQLWTRRRESTHHFHFASEQSLWQRSRNAGRQILRPDAKLRHLEDEGLQGKSIKSILATWGSPSNVTRGRNSPNETQYRFDNVNSDYVIYLF